VRHSAYDVDRQDRLTRAAIHRFLSSSATAVGALTLHAVSAEVMAIAAISAASTTRRV
jgi:hypothetical protein